MTGAWFISTNYPVKYDFHSQHLSLACNLQGCVWAVRKEVMAKQIAGMLPSMHFHNEAPLQTKPCKVPGNEAPLLSLVSNLRHGKKWGIQAFTTAQ